MSEEKLYTVQFGGSLRVTATGEAHALREASEAFFFSGSVLREAKNLGLRVAGSKPIVENQERLDAKAKVEYHVPLPSHVGETVVGIPTGLKESEDTSSVVEPLPEPATAETPSPSSGFLTRPTYVNDIPF